MKPIQLTRAFKESLIEQIRDRDRCYFGARKPREDEEQITTATEVRVWYCKGETLARVDGRQSWDLPLRLDLRNHSPSGFNWGYGGSGPAQLALAILVNFTGNEAFALAHYQDFKWHFLATEAMGTASRFQIEGAQIIEWIRKQPIRDEEEL